MPCRPSYPPTRWEFSKGRVWWPNREPTFFPSWNLRQKSFVMVTSCKFIFEANFLGSPFNSMADFRGVHLGEATCFLVIIEIQAKWSWKSLE
jgi:hypothetical protein